MFYSSFIVVQLTTINVYIQGKKNTWHAFSSSDHKRLISTSSNFACALKSSKYTENISNINSYNIICKVFYVKSPDVLNLLSESLYILTNISLLPLPSDNLKN